MRRTIRRGRPAAATMRKVRNGSRAGEDKKKVSAADRIPGKTGRKKWSVLFLESLLKEEAKEREAESEKARPAVDGELDPPRKRHL